MVQSQTAPTNESPAALLASSLRGLSQTEIQSKLRTVISETDAATLEYEWRFWARPNQLPPETQWFVWLVLTGRGWGKTRTGAEWVRRQAEGRRCSRLALVTDTAADARDVMVEGESGILACSPPWYRPNYEPSKRRLTWPDGQVATLYSAEDPEQLRGPQHDGAWCDEIAKWKRPETWDNLMFGLRLGQDPRCVVTTTPKPVRLVRELVKQPDVTVTRGTFYENEANLAPSAARRLRERYEGSRLGRQELLGELLDDVPGALWTRQMIDELRVSEAPEFTRVVVAIDPAMTSGDEADETGIVVVARGENGHGYVLRDVSGRFSPQTWAQRALGVMAEYRGDRIVAEVNNGGEMVEHTLRTVDRTVPYKAVHASRGKRVRAEPIAALYEQGRMHHVGSFPELEDQMCSFTPDGYDGSPDRLDAMVWAVTELNLVSAGGLVVQ